MIDDQQIFTFVLILARVSSFIAFFPLFAQRQLPKLVKAGLSMALTLFWFGTMPPELLVDADMNVLNSFLYLGKEIGLGFLLAVMVGFIFVPARVAGAYIGQEIGLSLASVASPGSADSSTLVTTLFETFAILLFFGLNLHHFMITFLHHSLIHVGANISLTDLPTELLIQIAGSLTEQGNLIVGPAGICLFVLTIGLALLNKAAPTLNLFSVGMTLRSGIGILCLIAFLPVIIKSMEMYFRLHQSQLEKFLIFYQ
jgi:flagellar biosynthetic protein FliR